MNDAEAFRVLGLPPRADVTTIRRAFAAQVRVFREAYDATTDPAQQDRIDRALKLTLQARNQLIVTETRSFAITQELPTQPGADGLSWRGRLALLVMGAGLLVLGSMLPFEVGPEPAGVASRPSASAAEADPIAGPESGAASAPRDAASTVAARPSAGASSFSTSEGERVASVPTMALPAAGAAPERAWLDPIRVALARAWSGADERLPVGATRIAATGDQNSGWRLHPQMYGGFAFVAGEGSATQAAPRWLLAMPALLEAELAWGCFTSIGAGAPEAMIAGCLTVPGSTLTEAVLAGRAGPLEVAVALQAAGLTDSLGVDGWLAQALDRGDGRAAQRLAESVVDAAARRAGGDGAADAAISADALVWYARAEQMFEAADDLRGRIDALAAMARIAALEPTIAPETAARHMLACRDLQGRLAGPPRCPTPGQLGRALEAVSASTDDWGRARWWYQQAFVERERAGAEGLARLHALGRLGVVDPQQALSILEDAAQHWDDFGAAELALTAARIASIWRHGWGVSADASESIWWSAQAARRGHAAEAVQLAAGFALGAGTSRDMERAREVVDLFARVTPLFEVAFHRRVGERLAEGAGVVADPEAARAWLRRAFERCLELADDGNPDAQLELAGMYFEGLGTEPDVRRAAALYEDLVEHAPLKAGNMLAWIRATHPDPALRDGAVALREARAVVAQAPLADYHDTLAAAFAEAGDFDAALTTQQQALALLSEEADPVLGGLDVAARHRSFSERLAQFEQGRPWRDQP